MSNNPSGPRSPWIALATAFFLQAGPIPQGNGADPSAAPLGSAVEIQPLRVDTTTRLGFTSVDPNYSGIAFTNSLSAARAAQNRNLMNGSGVALGDFDGDGRCDIYLCSLSGTNALYRNLGNWRFEEMGAVAGVATVPAPATGATWADLDGDGALDLLVSTLGAGIQYFRNLGQRRFELATSPAGLATKSGSTSLVLGDVDGDRDLDLYVVNYGAESVLRSGGRAGLRQVNGTWEFTGPNAHRLRYVNGRVEEVGEAGVLYLNDGSGHFQPVPWNSPFFTGIDGHPKAAPLDYGLGAQMRDINGDGAPDLYICNDFQMPDRLWLNDGSGRFREADFQVLRKFPFSSMGVDFGDLDRDGYLDFLVVEMASREIGRAKRQLSGLNPAPNLPGHVEFRPQVVRNALYRSNGDGTWSEIAEFANLAASDWSWQPVFLDVDLDGWEDILIVNGMMFDTQDRDALAKVRELPRQSPELSRTNLLLYPPFFSPNLAFRNLGEFAFEDVSAPWHFNSTRISHGIALGDLDGDGDVDLVINCLNDGALLYRNDCPAPRLAVTLRGAKPNALGIGARVRVEGGPVFQQQEITAGGRYLSGDEPARTFACGTSQQLSLWVTWRSGKMTIASNVPPNSRVIIKEGPDGPTAPPPIPAKPKPWFARARPEIPHRHHEEVFDDFQRQPLLFKQLSSLGPGVAWMDFDRDGTDECVVGTGRGGRLGAFRFETDGTPVAIPSDWVAPDDVAGLTGWITADSRPALLAVVTGYEQAVPDGRFLYEITTASEGVGLKVAPLEELPGGESSVGAIAAADYDGDGDLDLFVGARVTPGEYPRSGTSLLFRRNGPRLVLDASASALLGDSGMVSSALWSDLENDGFPELILACEWGALRLWRNSRGHLTPWDPPVLSVAGASSSMSTLSKWTGWWSSVTTGDVNQDGRLDIIAGNWGLNSGYRASVEHPLKLYYGKLMRNGNTDLIEAVYDPLLRRDVPRRSLNALAQALPFLDAKYPSHTLFSQAGVDEILSDLPNSLSVASVEHLESTVFLNLPDGLHAIPLPSEAQFAPVFGLQMMDADGDGVEDLFLAQNFFAMRIEWPRNDAGRGLWLRGDGTGRFAAVSASDSGIVMLGEQRGVAAGDYDRDGHPDLLVGQNGYETILWRNGSDGPTISLELIGPVGNPSSYGATVTVPGSKISMREVRASSGYLSKESSSLSLPASPALKELVVRWPGGQTTTVPVPSIGKRFQLHQGAMVLQPEKNGQRK